MSKGCLQILGVVVAGFLSLLTLSTRPQASSTSPIDLLMLDTCTASPCLFGHSLQEANYEHVASMLENTPLTQGAAIEHDDTTLKWFWPEVIASQLAPASNYPPFYYNYINFRQGGVDSVKLIFTIRLDELINKWGEPNSVIPFSYTHWGDMEILLDYGESRGYFGVLTSCSEPELTPDKLVRFHFSARPGTISRDFELPWSGYASDLPDCTIFQP